MIINYLEFMILVLEIESVVVKEILPASGLRRLLFCLLKLKRKTIILIA